MEEVRSEESRLGEAGVFSLIGLRIVAGNGTTDALDRPLRA
jgi:hypothetical protein